MMSHTLTRIAAALLLAIALPACGSGGGDPAAPPGAFTLVAPAAGAMGVAPRTSFSWNASTGAVSYLLEVAKDAAFTNLVVQTSVGSTGHLLPAPLKGNTIHYWRVTAVNGVGSTLCDAAPLSFTTGPPVPGNFSLLKPLAGQGPASVYAVFSWDMSDDATSYLIEISQTADFSVIEIQQAALTQISFAPAARLSDGATYYWRVTATNPNGSASAGPESFTTAPLGAPTWTGELVALADTSPQLFVSVNPATAAIAKISGEGIYGFSNVQALAHDPNTDTTYASDVGTSQLLKINPDTGIVTPIGFTQYKDLVGLAFDPGTQTLFGTALNTFDLLTLNTTTGLAGVRGPMGSFGSVRGLTFDDVSGLLLGSYANNLIQINPTTGAGSTIGSFGVGVSIPGLDRNPGTGVLYGAKDFNDNLVTINPVNAQVTEVGPFGFQLLDTLGFDSTRNRLVATDGRRFLTVNTTTGAATSSKGWSFYNVMGLAYQPQLGKLYGVTQFDPQLLLIDPVTGTGRTIAPIGASSVESLAYDPNAGVLYAVDGLNARLLTINVTTGAVTPIGPAGSLGSGFVRALEFDPVSNTLYGHDSHKSIVKIDTTTGTSTGIGATIQNIEGLAFDPSTGRLYGASTSDQFLYRINPSTGGAVRVGPIGMHIQCMSFDPATGTLLAANGQYFTTHLYRIDPLSGRATGIGAVGLYSAQALTYDPLTQTIFGMERLTNPPHALVRINPTSGEATQIGRIGAYAVEALAFDASTRTLYATNYPNDQLLTLNPNTGQATVVGSVGFSFLYGLAVHPGTNVLYGLGGGQLLTINKATGQGTAIGLLNATGIAFHPTTHQLYAVNANTRGLYTVNAGTGSATLVGTSPRGLWDLIFR